MKVSGKALSNLPIALVDKPSEDHQPASGTKDFWDEWDSKKQDYSVVSEAVEVLRRKSR